MNISTLQIQNILKVYNRQMYPKNFDDKKQGAVNKPGGDRVTFSLEGKKLIMERFVSKVVEKVTGAIY